MDSVIISAGRPPPDHADDVDYVYGDPEADVVQVARSATQTSPFSPDSVNLEGAPELSASRIVVFAPRSTIERRAVIALALRAIQPDGELVCVAPKDKGGSRLRSEMESFGCQVEESARRHQKICRTLRPAAPIGLDEAIAAGALQFSPKVQRWTQPGIFSWDRLDPATELLIAALPSLAGLGADLGCGSGRLSEAVLGSDRVTSLQMLDIDRRAIAAARRNVGDGRAAFHWANVLSSALTADLDFVVMNPPFHEGGGGVENRNLGQDFIRAAHGMLRKGGMLWMVANRHLPYEGVLHEMFSSVESKAEAQGFKVIAARK